jgi:hypothetical protein
MPERARHDAAAARRHLQRTADEDLAVLPVGVQLCGSSVACDTNGTNRCCRRQCRRGAAPRRRAGVVKRRRGAARIF